jgi:hypothetical protein
MCYLYFCSIVPLPAEDQLKANKIKNFCLKRLGFISWQLARYKKYLITGSVLALIVVSNDSFCQDRLLYRYVDEKGVKVLTYTIPTRYIPNGYEIIDPSGQLIQVVSPELSPEAKVKAATTQAEMEKLQIWDQQLLKRYSQVSDIEAAKERKLDEISANINILQVNTLNLKNEINKLHSEAAAIERSGKPIPSAILNNINVIKEELTVTADKIDLRQKEYQMQADKFDKDKARFLLIKAENIIEKQGHLDTSR